MRFTLTALLCAIVLGCCGEPCRTGDSQASLPSSDSRTTPAETPDGGPERETGTRVREILESKRVKGLVLEDASLDAAMTYLRTITGLVFQVTPAARASMLDNRISVRLDDVSVGTALLVMLEQVDLGWRDQAGVVMIMTRDERHPMRLRYYDIKDLSNTDAAGDAALAAAVRKDIGGDWEARGWLIEARKHILIIHAPGRVHDAVDAFLASRRSRR